MAQAIRTFDDNVEATAAWDGPLFDVWLHAAMPQGVLGLAW